MPRKFLAGLTFGAAAIATPILAQQKLTEKILEALEANPAFQALTPAGFEIDSIELQSQVVPGPLVWGPKVDPTGLTPFAIANQRGVNCDFDSSREIPVTLEGSYTETYSFARTTSASLAIEVAVEANWPFGSVSGSVTGTVSSSDTSTSGEGQTLSLSPGFVDVTPPRRYFDSQLQIFEQRVEGQPFHVDVEVAGKVKITYVPKLEWLPRQQVPVANRVVAGDEPFRNGKERRNLNVCRVGSHPGKVWYHRLSAGDLCFWTYAGKESSTRNHRLLSAPPGSVEWVSRADFEKDNSNDKVKDGDSTAVVAGRESRDDRYGGRLLVCRAEYKDGVHPGKVVINDCMIGYGGREIQLGNYDVLVRTGEGEKSKERCKQVGLADYLPDDLRTIRVEGVFEGGRALTSTVVIGPHRPVTDMMCAEFPAEGALFAENSVPETVAVTRQPAGQVPLTRTPIARAAFAAADSGAAPATAPREPLIDGRTFAEIKVGDDAPEAKIEINYRTMRAARPTIYGGDVLAMQKMLTEAGWPVREDGFYGRFTARAVRRFQTANGLRADGVFGPATEAALEAPLASAN